MMPRSVACLLHFYRMDNMPKIPEQRKPGQTGGGGKLGQTENRVKSEDRGGKPYEDGAGDDKKPKKKK